MKQNFSKLFSVLKKDGFFKTLKKLFKYIKSTYLSKINIFSYFDIKIQGKKYSKIFDDILSGNYDRIIIWKSSFGWNVPLFQRPQHISVNLAKQNCLVFYEVTTMTDNVNNIKKLFDNLFLINFTNISIKKLLFSKLEKINKPKYIQIYSTDFTMPLEELKEYINNGFKIIYEYIDDLSPEIVGAKEIPKNQLDKYNYMLKDTENIFTIVTASEIEKDVLQKRGDEKLAFSCNGVNIEHFKNIDTNFIFDEEYKKIIETDKPIIGYYGALASWFDYDLIKYLAEQRPNYNIVLLGVKYDSSLDKANLNKYSNIFFLGSKDYNVLQNYASKFSVCTIPFLINDITNATSPVKLFEYMALSKPIVTTAMPECKKYNSVFISNNFDEFVTLIDNSINIKNSEYFNLLEKEALENTWYKKAKIIIELIEKYE